MIIALTRNVHPNLPGLAAAVGAVRTVGGAAVPGSVVGINKILCLLPPVAMVI